MATRTQRAILTDIMELGLDPSEAHVINARYKRLEASTDSVVELAQTEPEQKIASIAEPQHPLVEEVVSQQEPEVEQVTVPDVEEKAQPIVASKPEAKKAEPKKAEKSVEKTVKEKDSKKSEDKPSS